MNRLEYVFGTGAMLAVHRHDAAARGFVGGVQAHAQVEARHPRLAQALDAVDGPDRADREALLRDLHAARVAQQAQHVQQVGVVQRLAHAHEHHVLELPAQHVPGHQQLGHDLVRPQVPQQPHARGLAEGAAHLAAHLAGHSQRVLVAPHGDEHALHLVAVLQPQHRLAVVPVSPSSDTVLATLGSSKRNATW
jgi:hypothetical protein